MSTFLDYYLEHRTRFFQKSLYQFLIFLVLLSMSLSLFAQVGWRTIQHQGSPIRVLYPTDAPKQTYHFGPFKIEGAENSPIVPGKRQLIVLSHGSGGSPLADHTLAAILVSRGFVVAQPMHKGDNYLDLSKSGPESWKTRPLEVSHAIDAIALDSVLKKYVETDKVGVHGMSAGGGTGMIMAGAQWSMFNLITHCGKNSPADVGFCLYGLSENSYQYWLRKFQFRVANWLPDDWYPANLKQLHGGSSSSDARVDSRVAAVSLLVPLGAIFTPESLRRVRIPVGIIQSESDQLLVPQFHSRFLLENCQACQLLLSSPEAGHFDWLDPWPESVAQEVSASMLKGGALNPNFKAHHRQAGFNKIADFFMQHLRN